MSTTVLVAGATGNLGEKIVKALIKKGAEVRALVRNGTDRRKVEKLEQLGAKIFEVNIENVEELTKACNGVSCVISSFAGLHDVIVDAQSLLLDAAVAADVPRFIPSDFSSDFTRIAEGENRNFDLRKEFHKKLDAAPIAPTSIFNGAFADILAYNTPFYNLKNNTVGYWGNDPDWHVDFTTMDNTADYTASVALDENAPEILRIASFQISPDELVALASDIKKTTFKLIPMGSLEELSTHNKKERAANPDGENELYPRWQGSQYMHSMFSVRNIPLDNDRYPDIIWASAIDVLSKI